MPCCEDRTPILIHTKVTSSTSGCDQLSAFLNHPRLLTKRDELAWSALHCLFIGTTCACEVGRESNHFFYMSVCIVPKLDAKREILVTPTHLSI